MTWFQTKNRKNNCTYQPATNQTTRRGFFVRLLEIFVVYSSNPPFGVQLVLVILQLTMSEHES